uniref:Serpentine receptor class gamma n=1 Tax=Panagrellus redivivus TaxID=6233 RepID=A0A7E4ZWR5_PANRE
MMLFSTICYKLPVYGWIAPDMFEGRFAVVPLIIVNYFGHAQAIGIVGSALNRFTAVFSPHRHRDYWWKASHVTIFTCIMWILPIFAVIPLFFAEFTVVKNNVTNGVNFHAKDINFQRAYFISIAALDGLVVNTFVGALYLSIFFRIQNHVHIRRPHELALRLATSAFIIFTCYLFLGVCSLLSALAPESKIWMYRSFWFIVNDVLCSTNAPVLLALNKPIRKKMLKTMGFHIQSTQKSSLLL